MSSIHQTTNKLTIFHAVCVFIASGQVGGLFSMMFLDIYHGRANPYMDSFFFVNAVFGLALAAAVSAVLAFLLRDRFAQPFDNSKLSAIQCITWVCCTAAFSFGSCWIANFWLGPFYISNWDLTLVTLVENYAVASIAGLAALFFFRSQAMGIGTSFCMACSAAFGFFCWSATPAGF